MQNTNVCEYDLLRKEITNIKNCITTYIGFLIGGSGIAFAGLAIVIKEDSSLTVKVGLPLVLSILVSMVQMILYYKFLSHNRFAGYCKLLIHERHYKKDHPPEEHSPEGHCHVDKHKIIEDTKDIFLWETCVDMMRRSDSNINILNKIINDVEIGCVCKHGGKHYTKEEFASFIGKRAGRRPEIDKWRYILGFKHLGTIIGRIKTTSWPFPAVVNTIFLILIPLFLVIAFRGLYSCKPHNVTFLANIFGYSDWKDTYIYWSRIAIIILFYQIVVWFFMLAKLYVLLDGSNTVDNYCWKLIPFRARFLNIYNNIIPEYYFMWCPLCGTEDGGQTSKVKIDWVNKFKESFSCIWNEERRLE